MGLAMIRGKVIFELTGLNIQMTSFDKKTKVGPTTVRHILKWSPLILRAYNKYYRRNLLLDIPNVILKKHQNRLLYIILND